MKLAIINYPSALKSAIYGLEELFEMANTLHNEQHYFCCESVCHLQLDNSQRFDLVILPPALNGDYYLGPSKELIMWLKAQEQQHAVLCSVCSGAFILAHGGFLNNKTVTTHWALAAKFQHMFPAIELDSNKIFINEGNVMTAGGVMSWLDLGLEIVARYLGPAVMTQLGKNLVVDTGQRAQSYYQQFHPLKNHGDQAIADVQDYLDAHYSDKILMGALAKRCHTGERSFLRRFQKATDLKPSEYIQKLRIQKACDLLERSNHSFDLIASQVGYEDSNACRRIFVRIMGLTPKQFRQRFVRCKT